VGLTPHERSGAEHHGTTATRVAVVAPARRSAAHAERLHRHGGTERAGRTERSAALVTTRSTTVAGDSETAKLRARLLAIDVATLAVGWIVGGAIGNAGSDTRYVPLTTGTGMIVVGVVATMACFAAAGLYRTPLNGIRSGALGRLVQSTGMAAVIVIVWQGMLADTEPRVALSAVAAAAVLNLTARCGFDAWLVARRERGQFRSAVVLAGAPRETTALLEFLRTNPESGFRATAVVGGRPDRSAELGAEAPWMGGLDRVEDAVLRTRAAGVLVGVNGLPGETVNDLAHRLSREGIPVHLSTGLSGVSQARCQTVPLAHEPIVHVTPRRHPRVQAIAKRALDLALAVVLLVVSAPLMAAAAVLVKAHDRGPALFRQVRIGRDGRPFTVVKMRTMGVDAEARLADLQHRNERAGPLFKVSRDPRITPVGGVLRSTGIDELPQLLNVIAGHMSMVGPRPALPAETADFDDELQRRHLVRPGVTGLWQVEANHKASFDEYRRLDLFYVDNWSVGGDLTVLLDTVQAVLRRVLRTMRRSTEPSAPASVDAVDAASVAQPLEVGS
jgi:exopolysaccharide biosynthesis polyprenyl glycosylphosphotransferase